MLVMKTIDHDNSFISNIIDLSPAILVMS